VAAFFWNIEYFYQRSFELADPMFYQMSVFISTLPTYCLGQGWFIGVLMFSSVVIYAVAQQSNPCSAFRLGSTLAIEDYVQRNEVHTRDKLPSNLRKERVR